MTRQYQRRRLTVEQVREIKFKYKDKRAKDIAIQFGVSEGCINSIKSGTNWAWVKE